MPSQSLIVRAASCLCVPLVVAATNAYAPPASGAAKLSINSTSQNGRPVRAVAQQAKVIGGRKGYQIFPANDLGMHCGDLDTRISSILPPFSVMHFQVIKQGREPDLLDPRKVSVFYSAASNPRDPVLSKRATARFKNPPQGSRQVYKTHFWETVARGAYDPFYPPGVTPIAPTVTADKGLLVPDLEGPVSTQRCGASDGHPAEHAGRLRSLSQEHAPEGGRARPDLPFFVDFPFGYRVRDVNWFEAAGIPLTTFDDAGRENAYPLVRAQARAKGGQVLATTDVVLPISGEADCQGCHAAKVDGGNGTGIKALNSIATSLDDPLVGQVPTAVSVEYAADINLLKLHDLRHKTRLITGTALDPTKKTAGNKPFAPVVCQVCHYSPALDLAHVGPRGPENDRSRNNPSNGRDQVKNQTMSRIMHYHHGRLRAKGRRLFPQMPSPVGRSARKTQRILAQTCYQCHPGKRTQCLRGAMGSANIVCQDCHGQMEQVGNDFSRNKP